MNRFSCVLLAAALAAALAGCHDQSQSPPAPSTAPGTEQTPPGPTTVATPPTVVVYEINPKATGEADLLTPHQITLKHPKEPVRDAVTALLNSDHSPMALGTTLRGVSIQGGVATLDFSQSFLREDRGEDAESAALNALARTLGQFPEIQSYQVEVQGKPVSTFGEFQSDGPMDVIRPGDNPESGKSEDDKPDSGKSGGGSE